MSDGTISVTFGASNTHNFPASDYPDVATLLSCPRARHRLGFGDNVEATVNGVSGVGALRAGDAVNLISRANKKG